MTDDAWKTLLNEVHSQGVAAWKAGRRSPTNMFTPEALEFLRSSGCSAQEMFDFVDDLQIYGEPDFKTVYGIQVLRRCYFKEIMHEIPSSHTASMESLPPKSLAVDGIAWLPRLIVKARLKLRGEMPPDLMYGCGGDRPFVIRMGMTLPSFLKLVWDCGDNDAEIVASIKKAANLR
jgi:Domain of unknown function (DUF5069)